MITTKIQPAAHTPILQTPCLVKDTHDGQIVLALHINAGEIEGIALSDMRGLTAGTRVWFDQSRAEVITDAVVLQNA